MNGVVKDDTPSTLKDVSSGDAADKAAQDFAAHEASRRAPHLRVVTEALSDLDAADEGAAASDQPQLRMGQVLQQTRENRGLTLEQVSRDTRITVSDLQAIEEMTPSLIRGGEVYIKGHVRNYARHLGLNPDETLARYKADVPLLHDPLKPQMTAQPKAAASKAGAGGNSNQTALIIGGSAVVVAAIAAFVFMSGDKDQPRVAAAPAAPASQTPSPATASPATPVPALRLVALRRAKIVVRGADGTKFLQRFMNPGETYAPRTGAGWTVSADEDGSAFEWRLGDMSLGLLAPDGGPVYAQSVDSALSRKPVGRAVEITAPAETDDGLNLNVPGAAAPYAPPAAARPAGAAPVAGTVAAPKPKPRPAPTVDTGAEVAPPPLQAAEAPQTPAADPALAAYPQ
jgi:hypothetical protein